MKIKEIKIYEFSELSSDSQNKAIEYFANNMDFSEFWNSDYRATLDKFCKLFSVKLNDWNVDTCNYNYRISHIDNNFKGMSLYKLIQNYFWDSLYSNKIYYKNNKKHVSKILFTENDNFTGFCADYAILKPIYDYIKKPNLNLEYRDLICECLDSFFEYWHKDIEYQYSAENIKEFIEINNYEFLESGELA